MSETITLKPCPFCGGEAEMARYGTPRVSCIVTCTNCGATRESPDEGAQSGSSWNERTLPVDARDRIIAIIDGPCVGAGSHPISECPKRKADAVLRALGGAA